jgi:hypothetical protein
MREEKMKVFNKRGEYQINKVNNGSPFVRIIVAGDLFCGGKTEKYLTAKEINPLWGELIEELYNHDVRMVNLENPLTWSNSRVFKVGPHLTASPKCAEGIYHGGFNVVTLANNHMKDMGDDGVIDTLRYCSKAGLYTVGAGINLEGATHPLNIEVNNIRISVLSIAEGEFSVAEKDTPGVWPLNLIDNYYQIQRAREISDFVLVIFHGGVEFYPFPTPDMVKTCRYFVDAGANCVVCHHIHVPSGLEIYKDSPIFYSTGNFLFDWPHKMAADGYIGYMISIEVSEKTVSKFRLIPYFQCKDEFGVKPMRGNDLSEFLDRIYNISRVIQDEKSLNFEFRQFVKIKRKYYLNKLLLLSETERKLFSKGVWPFWRTDIKRLAEAKNQFACRAHFFMMLSILEEELKNHNKSDI